MADADDAPGLMLLGLSLVFLPFAGLVLMNVLIKILEEAIRLKKNDELTVWRCEMAIIVNLDVMLAKRKNVSN